MAVLVLGLVLGGLPGCLERQVLFAQGADSDACGSLVQDVAVELVGVQCGEALCEVGEKCLSGQCVGWMCGDGVCQGGESCESCPGDCGRECVTEGFVVLEAGTFWMGSPGGEACATGYSGGGCPGGGNSIEEVPLGYRVDESLHQVTLTSKVEMLATEVTQGQWVRVFREWRGVDWNPANYKGCVGGPEACPVTTCPLEECPVEHMTWYDTILYLNALSERAGLKPCYVLSEITCAGTKKKVGSDFDICLLDGYKGIYEATVGLSGVATPYECEGYRLPTEAEWEYAARAGTSSAYGNGQDLPEEARECQTSPLFNLIDYGFYCAMKALTRPQAVGQKLPNGFGMYDMHGNLWEWCWDDVSGNDYQLGVLTDPTGESGFGYRAVRGGSFKDKAIDLRSANRGRDVPFSAALNTGFRVVRTLP